MAKSSRGGRRASSSSQQSHTGATILSTGGGTIQSTRNYTQMTDQYAQQLRDDMDDSYDPDVSNAIKLYISKKDVNGDGYSYSQNLNYKLDNGLPLDVNEKYIDTFIQQGMHDIGQDTVLFRACHDDILKKCGINDYTKLNDSQLQSKLIGTEFITTSYTSASYDKAKNPFTNPSSGVSGGREVFMNIKASSTTKMVFGAKSQAEMVLNKGTKMRITGIHYDGTYASPRNSGRKPRVVIDIETFD